tara:strand:+ start:7973 stop:8260 length:288 start_codon:yes stop_codon:yes gene_type:complete
MDRVDKRAEHYLGVWNDSYAQVNDPGIVNWAVTAAMRDIESWVEGWDPNGAKESAGVEDWSRSEFIRLYRALSPTAAFFEYAPRSDILSGPVPDS